MPIGGDTNIQQFSQFKQMYFQTLAISSISPDNLIRHILIFNEVENESGFSVV